MMPMMSNAIAEPKQKSVSVSPKMRKIAESGSEKSMAITIIIVNNEVSIDKK